MRVLLALLLTLVGTVLVIWLLAPREEARLQPVRVDLPADLQEWLARREAKIAPDLAAQIDWAGPPGAQTEIAIVYLHGFSASPRETAPVPQKVAAALGANLFLTRLTGHGQDGTALAAARAGDWWRDTTEALAVGQRLGRRVVVIGTSTGATLAAEAARDPLLGQGIAGVVMISGNFGLRNRAARLLEWPLARYWVPLIAGRTRCFQPLNADHAAAWTSCYPTVAILPVAALVRHSRQGDYDTARQPALFIWSDGDQVVDPAAAMRVADLWRGPVRRQSITLTPGDDPANHVITGDILSPGTTDQVSAMIADWIAQTLP